MKRLNRWISHLAWVLDDVNHRTGLNWVWLCEWNDRRILRGT